jgi:uncharacterized membrane protein YfcA
MTDAIVPDHHHTNLPPNIHAATAIPGRVEFPGERDTHGIGPPGLWRNAILALMGSAAWILTASVLVPQEKLSALTSVFVAATISSIAGFAFSAVAGGMLLHIINSAVEVVMIMMVCSIAIQSLSVVFLWRDIDLRRLTFFLFGGIVGLPIGVWLLLHLDPAWFKGVMGALLIVYAAYGLFRPPVSVRTNNRMWDVLVGCLGGVTGGLVGFPGAAVTVWCGVQGWNRRGQRAIYQPYILVMQILGLLIIRVLHPTAVATDKIAMEILPFVPVALSGAWMGLKIFERISDNHFKLAVNLLLFASGVSLIL